MPRKRTFSSVPNSGTTTHDTTTGEFDKVFAVIDSAISAAIIAGVHPGAFEAEISFWFLKLASRALPPSDQRLRRWMQDLDTCLTPVIDSVERFAQTYDGYLRDLGEADEFDQLSACVPNIEFFDMNELDRHRQTKQVVQIMQWIESVLSRCTEASDQDFSAAFLLEFLKLLALSGGIERQAYLTVKQSMPVLCGIYRDALQ
jgi:hypothetical protein